MSWYVKRTHLDDPARTGWVGPIRSQAQAGLEIRAWEQTGQWKASRHESTPEVRREVREWAKAAKARRG